MAAPLVPLPQTVWKLRGSPKDSTAPLSIVEVVFADQDAVTVRSLALGVHDVRAHKLKTFDFVSTFLPVPGHQGPTAERGVRTRWERLLDEEGDF